MIYVLILSLFPACMIGAAAYDISTMTIPNWISLALIIAFVALAIPAGMTISEIGIHIAIGMAALIAGFLLFTAGFVGGGDAKFLAATSLWIGSELYLHYFFFATLAGGVLALSLLFLRQFSLPSFLVNQEWIARLHHSESGIPYGVALSIGGLFVFFQTPLFRLIF